MDQKTWLGIEPLSDATKVSVRSFRKLVAEGHLVPGKHFYKVGNHVNGKQIFCLEEVRQVLLSLTEKAAKEKSISKAITYDQEHSAQLVAGGRV